ncbi:hypothetical protein Tco_1268991, partial [Tanacetum coccineum]
MIADHSLKWHDGSSSRNIDSSSNTEVIAAIVRAHLDKEYPLNKEVKSVEEVKYGEFGRSFSFSNRAKYRVGPLGYYTCINNRPQMGKDSLKILKTQIEQLRKEFHAKSASKVPNSLVGQCKADYANDEAPINNTSSDETKEVSFIANNEAHVTQEEDDVPTKVLPCQLPLKELNPGSFTLPCTIGSLNSYVMADL